MLNKISRKVLVCIVATVMMMFSATAISATFWKQARVIRTLVDSQAFQGCMVLLDSPVGGSCPSAWVSLDCDGGLYGNAPMGQLAFATASDTLDSGRIVALLVNDAVLANGYCSARRVDVLR